MVEFNGGDKRINCPNLRFSEKVAMIKRDQRLNVKLMNEDKVTLNFLPKKLNYKIKSDL